MLKFIKESREELRKVVWPGRDEILHSTIVVLVSVVLISVFLYAVDKSFEALFDLLVKSGTGS
jgi:preprotein translocase subunit SecE